MELRLTELGKTARGQVQQSTGEMRSSVGNMLTLKCPLGHPGGGVCGWSSGETFVWIPSEGH